jgi:hypothetical protein
MVGYLKHKRLSDRDFSAGIVGCRRAIQYAPWRLRGVDRDPFNPQGFGGLAL